MLKKLATSLLVILPFVLFLYFRLDGIIGDMSNSDGLRWHRRSANFSQALLNRDFAQTYQRYHPGVTLMWLSSFTEWGIKLYDRYYNIEFKTIGNTGGFLIIDTASKVALVFVLFYLLLLQFKYIKTLYDKDVALLFVFVCALEPYFVGINRWYHLTSLEVALAFCSFLTLILWSELKDKRYLVKSGIFFGLALLTKFSSLFVLPVLVVIFVFTVYKKRSESNSYYVKAATTFTLASVVTFVALFPALWVAPIKVLSDMFGAAISSGAGDYRSVVYAEVHPYLYYFVVLLFKLSPITIILFLMGILRSYRWKDSTAFFLLFYIASQLFLLLMSEQKIERYILSFFPALLLFVAVTLARFHKHTRNLALVLIVFSFGLAYKNFHPLYSAYYSSVLGGPRSAYKIGIYDDNGEFFAKAASYLNEKGRDIHVHVPFNVESFSPYFKGKLDATLSPEEGYFVVSKDARRPKPMLGINCPTIERAVINNDLEAVTIYKCEDLDEHVHPLEKLLGL